MYTVWTFDDACVDDVMVYSGSLADCLAYVDGDDEFYIVEPNGYVVYGD